MGHAANEDHLLGPGVLRVPTDLLFVGFSQLLFVCQSCTEVAGSQDPPPMPIVLLQSWGGWRFLKSEVTLKAQHQNLIPSVNPPGDAPSDQPKEI